MTSCPLPHRTLEMPDLDVAPALAEVGPAHVLAAEAHDVLANCGFEQSHILWWAEAYIAEERVGTVEDFALWIHSVESG